MLFSLADEDESGIGRGEAIASYLEMGAAGVQLGTRFACATESIAHPDFKKAFFRASAREAVASVQVDPRLPVIPVRALKNKGTEEFTAKQREVAALLDAGQVDMAEAQLQIEHFWAGALRRAVIDGDVEYGSVMAGQSVGMVHVERPVVDIIAKLVREAAMQALRQRGWTPDYLTLRRQHDLSPVSGPCADPLVVLGAAKLGKTRLIDNFEV